MGLEVSGSLTDACATYSNPVQIRDPTVKAACEALADAEDDARKAHRGIWEHGDPGDSDDDEPARPPPVWGKKK